MSRPSFAQVLASIQTLSRGNPFDDICLTSRMSDETARRSFYSRVKYFSRAMHGKWAVMPAGPGLAPVMSDYDELGFTGAMGSTDATHVHWANTFCSTRHAGKEKIPTLAYRCTVDHSDRCLGIRRDTRVQTTRPSIIREVKQKERKGNKDDNCWIS